MKFMSKIDSCRHIPLQENLRMAAILLLLVMAPMLGLAQAVYCVRSGATGAGTGADWNNAFTSLPATLVRGATYYIADGTYPSYDFNDPVSGTQYITVKKATIGEHGISTSWSNSYGDGVAEWPTAGKSSGSSMISFSTSYIIFDGVTGGGPGSWTTGHGFVLSGTENVYFMYFKNSSADIQHVDIKHVSMGSPNSPVAGVGTAIYMSPVSMAKRNITISYNYIHDIGDSMHPWYTDVSEIYYEYNCVARNASSSVSHGAGMEFGDCSNIHIRYNCFIDMVGTGVIGIYNPNTSDVINNLFIYGNIFYNTPGFAGESAWNGIIYCVSNAKGTQSNIKVYNNTFYNISPEMILDNSKTIDGHEAVNNIIYKTHGTPGIKGYSHSFNASNDALGEVDFQLLSADPFVDAAHGDFRLVGPTATGIALPAPFDRDMYNNPRGTGGTWDRGACEFSGTVKSISAARRLRLKQ